jgi:glycosyltransferase involved in cell wall biosynthesis
MYANKAALGEFRRWIARHVPEGSVLEFTFDEGADPGATQTVFHLRRAVAEERAAELTPVMARLGPADLETLDALITAGIVASRAEGLRWALARIRDRPAYAQLRERAREIERLKTEF